MSKIIIHNGNNLVVPFIQNLFKIQGNPIQLTGSMSEENLKDISTRLAQENSCAEITVADKLSHSQILEIKSEKTTVIKVISSYNLDRLNLHRVWYNQTWNWISDYNNIKDPSWPLINSAEDWTSLSDDIKNECQKIYKLNPIFDDCDTLHNNFTESFWHQSVFYGLTVSDEIIFLDDIYLDVNQSASPLVFTPGRCGTHVLMDILKTRNYLHHGNNLIDPSNPDFSKLINASKIHSILRRSFIDQVCSDTVANRYDVMLTQKTNFDQNIEKIKNWEKFDINDTDFNYSLDKFINYTDILLGLDLLYNKKVEFCLLEDLSHWLDQITYKKNPYSYQDLILNYNEIYQQCMSIYQPIYDQIIKKIKSRFGQIYYINH